MRTFWIKRGIGISLAIVAGAFLMGYMIMYLWNWLMPQLFGSAHLINYWQAMGVLILSKILFGGFKGRRCGCGHWGHHDHWRARWKEKWETMSEEEREKVRRWCGPGWEK